MPFVGKILIDDVWSGGSKADGEYPLMSYAISCGLYHPRCKDSHTTYFPGITTADGTWTKEELKEIGLENKQEARAQYAARQAKKYARLAKYSLDPEKQANYSTKAEQWEKEVAKSEKSGRISSAKTERPMDLQLFAEKGIETQSSASLRKGISSLKKRVEEHERKIANPASIYPKRNSLDDQEKQWTIEHWKIEIENFEESIANREIELRKRGDM